MDLELINEIRILPSDRATFAEERDFQYFVEHMMDQRGGYYYFPSQMMKCPTNTFVLFQYSGMIRATGVLIESAKKLVVDEDGKEYAGYYKFDINTLHYLSTPIDKESLKTVYPEFEKFNQAKKKIPLQYLGSIYSLLQRLDTFYRDDSLIVETIEKEISSLGLIGESRDAVVKVRVNQGVFREKLLQKYSKCCLCGVSNKALLTASHIKPWCKSNALEKLDIENGFLMCPNHDRLFDQGWITFDNNGKIIIADEMSQEDRIFMNVNKDMKITLSEKNKIYLQYHRSNIFYG